MHLWQMVTSKFLMFDKERILQETNFIILCSWRGSQFDFETSSIVTRFVSLIKIFIHWHMFSDCPKTLFSTYLLIIWFSDVKSTLNKKKKIFNLKKVNNEIKFDSEVLWVVKKLYDAKLFIQKDIKVWIQRIFL